MDIFGNFSKLKGDKEKRKVSRKASLVFSYSDLSLEPISQMEDKSTLKSFFAVQAVLFLIFGLLIFKLFMLQVYAGDSNQKLAQGNKVRPRVTEANRGLISDKNGVWLARNDPSFALALYPADLPKNKSEREAIYAKISEIANLTADEVKSIAEKNSLSSLDQVYLKENLSHDDALILEEKIAGISGVFIAKTPIREYKSDAGLAHILGYTGLISEDQLAKSLDYLPSDRTGKSGIEATYEDYLKGAHGVEQVEVDSRGNIIKILVDEENRAPIAGDDLVLNIDYGLQQATAKALQSGIDAGKAAAANPDAVTGGVAIVMDVNTGGIRAMVSLPSYDDNLFSPKISSADYQSLLADKNLPMFDRAIQGTYPPGSISKIILASAGLQEGTITKSTSFTTPAAIQIGDYTFPDWKDHSYESTNVERAIAESNNVFFYSLGGGYDKIRGLGMDSINKYWQLFGLGDKSGIDLPSEASGFLPTPAWKQQRFGEPWYIGDTYHVSIGQGDLLVTPIQMLRATAAIANGGKLLKPQIVNEIVDPSGKVVKQYEPVVIRENFIDPSVVKTIQEGMRLTITDGSARNLNDLPVSVAGKTGTAQFFNNEKTHAWFECYAPYENPEIAVIVLVDGGGGGHEIAAPVAKEILSYYFGNK